jgi:signal peptidase I
MPHSDNPSLPENPSALATSALKTVIGEDLFATRLDNQTAYSATAVNNAESGNNENHLATTNTTITSDSLPSLALDANVEEVKVEEINSYHSATVDTTASDSAAKHSVLFDHQLLAAAPEFAIVATSEPMNPSDIAAAAAVDPPAALMPTEIEAVESVANSWNATVNPVNESVALPATLEAPSEEGAALLPETVITGTPIAIVPRASISMPKLYVQVRHNEPIRGYAAGEDLPLEVSLGQEASSWSFLHEFRSLMRDFFFAGLSAVLLVIFAVQPVKVEGTSMLPKLFDGERIFINKFIYQVDEIKRGDVVVFWYPKNPNQSFIKRVIGIPGDEVRFTNGRLFINNKLVPEPYLSANYTKNPVPNRYWVVEDHHYFVMGDNRDASNDSRAWGLVPEKYIYGKAFFRYWPLDRFGALQK